MKKQVLVAATIVLVAIGSWAVAHAGPHANSDCSKVTTAPTGECEICDDWVVCQEELDRAGATAQVVPLKNGIMYVFMADTPRKARLVQATLARRQERLKTLMHAGEKAHLCPMCKEMRGAALSGKLQREVINIEGGCIVMVTSKDSGVVSKIYAQAGVKPPSRSKS
jgi:hypothetical protein